jgi:hypothetical protein
VRAHIELRPIVGRRSVLRNLACVAAVCAFRLDAQQRESSLSEAEVDILRDTAYVPADRVLAFIKFLDQRTKEIDKISAGRRRPGREEDIHDQMEQFTSIADDLDDNLEDYSKRHLDIRKSLLKLLSATERWATALKSPPDDDAYKVSRKLALETLADIRETATKMVEEQKAWFLAHPPAKGDDSRSAPRR